MSEVLNVLRLMMSWLGSQRCPNGRRIGPSLATPRPLLRRHVQSPECRRTQSPESSDACSPCRTPAWLQAGIPAL